MTNTLWKRVLDTSPKSTSLLQAIEWATKRIASGFAAYMGPRFGEHPNNNSEPHKYWLFIDYDDATEHDSATGEPGDSLVNARGWIWKIANEAGLEYGRDYYLVFTGGGCAIVFSALTPIDNDWSNVFLTASKDWPGADRGIYKAAQPLRVPGAPHSQKGYFSWALTKEEAFTASWEDLRAARTIKPDISRMVIPSEEPSEAYISWLEKLQESHQAEKRKNRPYQAFPEEVQQEAAMAYAEALGLEYKLARRGVRLIECPLCGEKYHAFLGPTGRLRCYSSSCVADGDEGLPKEIWLKASGRELPNGWVPPALPDGMDPGAPPEDMIDELLEEAPDGFAPYPSRAKAEEAMKESICEMIRGTHDGEALVISATPGLGKTTISIHEVVEYAKDTGALIVWANHLRKESYTAFQALSPLLPNGSVIWAEGRHEELEDPEIPAAIRPATCRRWNRIKELLDAGYSIGEECKNCPFYSGADACRFARQRKLIYKKVKERRKAIKGGLKPKPLIIVTPTPTGLSLEDKYVDLLVIDEDPRGALVRRINIDKETLRNTERACVEAGWLDGVPLLQRLQEIMVSPGRPREKDDGWGGRFRLDILMTKWYKPDELRLACAKWVEDSIAIYDSHDKKKRLPSVFIKEFIGLLAFNDDPPGTAIGLYRSVGSKEWKLHLTDMRDAPKAKKIIILDAYADRSIYESLLRRPINFVRFDVRIPPGVRYCNIDVATSKSALMSETRREWLRDKTVKRILEGAGGKKALFIVHKEWEAYWTEEIKIALEDALVPPKEWKVAHFYALRGSNAYRDYDVVTLLGTPYADIDGLTPEAKALGVSKTALEEAASIHEMLQCIHRIRPIDTARPSLQAAKVIFVVSHLHPPLPGAVRIYAKPCNGSDSDEWLGSGWWIEPWGSIAAGGEESIKAAMIKVVKLLGAWTWSMSHWLLESPRTFARDIRCIELKRFDKLSRVGLWILRNALSPESNKDIALPLRNKAAYKDALGTAHNKRLRGKGWKRKLEDAILKIQAALPTEEESASAGDPPPITTRIMVWPKGPPSSPDPKGLPPPHS